MSPSFLRTPKPHALLAVAMLSWHCMPAGAAETVTGNAPVIIKPATGGKSITKGSSAAGATLYWYDGSRRRMLIEQPGADLGTKGMSEAARRAVVKSATPVFVDADGGKTRALPGGVIVRVAQPTDARELEARLAAHDAGVLRRIGDSGRVWLIAGQAGVASIELANAIHESGLVESASPNWVSARVRK